MEYMDLLPPTAPSLVFARETCTPYCSQNAMLSQVCTDTQGLTCIWVHRRAQLCTPPTPETFKRSLTVSLDVLFAAVDVASIVKIWHLTLS